MLSRRKKGGFTDLQSFRAELGVSEAEVSDDEARKLIDESLDQRRKLSHAERDDLDAKTFGTYNDDVSGDMVANLRSQNAAEERERKRLESELAADRRRLADEQRRAAIDRANMSMTQQQLSNALETEKLKRLYGTPVIWKSPSSLDDFLTKERLKREVKEELLEEKKRVQRQKELAALWAPAKAPRSKSPRAKSPRSKSPRAKSPRSKSPKNKKKKTKAKK